MASGGAPRLIGSRRVRSLVLGAIVLIGVPSVCGRSNDVEVLDVWVRTENTLVFTVNTCNEETTEVTVVESDTEVVVTASTRKGFSCGGDDCADPRSVDLDEPLGDRRIVDGDGNDVRRLDQ